MEICYLPINNLRKNPNNPFAPLLQKEYEELRESIREHGIMDPLIVYPEVNGSYTVISGNNRLRAADELGIKKLPCIIINKTMIEGALDTEIFRRHLTPEEREESKKLKKEICDKVIDEFLKEKLVPELYENYKNKKISRQIVLSIAINIEKEHQIDLVKLSGEPYYSPDGNDDDDDDQEKVEEKYEYILTQKDELLKKKGKTIEKLKEAQKELEKELEENEEEIESLKYLLQKAKADAVGVVREELQEQIANAIEVNENLKKQLREKDAEIEKMKDEVKKEKNRKLEEEVKIKGAAILELEERKKYMFNIILFHLDEVLEKIKVVRKRMADSELPIKDAMAARDKIQNIIEAARELLPLIKIIPRPERKKEISPPPPPS